MNEIMRMKIIITGIVQGVGFRPTVYQYATRYNLVGYVNNTVEGVFIEVQGEQSKVDEFICFLRNNPPPEAHVDDFFVTQLPPNSETQFSIIQSEKSGQGDHNKNNKNNKKNKSVEISPDLATCKDCLAELNDSQNRRYGYPFINCTNCGPRFTIIRDRPYDRPLTSMASFPMCPACQDEYDSPMNRRFHAQPNACPACGPKLHLVVNSHTDDRNVANIAIDPLNYTIEKLKDITTDAIVAIKGLGGFNFCCSPWNMLAVKRLRQIKNRPTKSFALMAKNIDVLSQFVHISDAERKSLTSSAAPIVLLRKKGESLNHIAPDNNYLGVMLAHTPLHHLLFTNPDFDPDLGFDLLIMTSANHAEEPIAHNDNEILPLIEEKLCDFALSHNREIVHRADDSIIHFVDERPLMIRRSRGFVPRSLILKNNNYFGESLSLGSHMKNTFALRKGSRVYLSQHIGEMEDVRTIAYQQEQIKDLQQLFEITPQILIKDAHPGFAIEVDTAVFNNHNNTNNNGNDSNHHHITEVYHHHAHALSVMSEHHLLGGQDDILAIIADGTGFGTDGTLWGWEFLKIAKEDYRKATRLASLAPFPMAGGTKAIYEVDRLGIALTAHFSPEQSSRLTPHYENSRRDPILQLIKKKINTPLTSSLGRLFDGIASLLDISQKADYEAQSAILLQKYAEAEMEGPLNSMAPNFIRNDLPLSFFTTDTEMTTIDPAPMIRELLERKRQGIPATTLSLQFHLWVVENIMRIVNKLNKENTKAEAWPIVLSGGCFQNSLLLKLLINRLTQDERKFYINEQYPCNDGGLALGQASI